MLKAIKESLKNWLEVHERLYWYIVVGLAVLAFGFITALGCAKLENANAAAEITVNAPEINYDTLPTYQQVVDAVVDTFGVSSSEVTAENTVMFTSDGNSYVVFYGADIAKLECYGLADGCNINAKSSVTRISINVVTDTVTSRTFSGPYMGISSTRNEYQGYVWGAPIYSWERNGTKPILVPVSEYPVHIPPASYSPDAPYFSDVTYSNVNLFMIDGNMNFDESTFRFVFDIVSDGKPYTKRIAKLSGYVYLPSKDFIDKAVQYYMGGRDTLDAYYSIYSCKEYPNWLKSIDLGDGSTYEKWSISFDVECGDNLDLRLSHNDIFRLIEECNGINLKEYYGIDNVAFIDHILKGYMWVHRLDGYITTSYSDSAKYGNLTSFVMSTYLDEPVIVVGNSDPLFVGPMPPFVGPMLPDTDVQQNINQAYKDALDQAIKENESLNNSIDGYLDTSGAYGDLEGSDLWSSFRSLADGLASMAPSVRAIASLTGAVLAFMPLQVTGIISFTLVALCIIAIIKAIRG